jgi:hypothetical protein
MAEAAVDALRRTVWRDGRLYATLRDGAPALPAYLDDHAFLLDALVERMQCGFRRADYDWAIALADALLERFEDRERGGFWFTAHDHEALFHRTMPGHDNATPSGNGVAARALASFGALAGEPRYLDAARRAVSRFASSVAHSPGGYATLLEAAHALEHPPTQVILAGASAADWRDRLRTRYRPHVEAYVVDASDAPPSVVKGPAPASGARAWVCRGTTCLPPVDASADLEALIAPAGGG